MGMVLTRLALIGRGSKLFEWVHSMIRDAEWRVIKMQLRGHNDTRFGRPTPGRHIGRPGLRGLAALRAFLVVLSYY
jgi:hypothetical protein